MKKMSVIKHDSQLPNELLYILIWVKILQDNATWILKLINIKQKYFKILRNYTKIISELNYKKIIKITIIFHEGRCNNGLLVFLHNVDEEEMP